jgi:hypothetical protein
MSREVVLNLWYVLDEEGIIYSLRTKAYVMEGSDEEKLAFLQERARLDYLIAEPFEIPKRFHLTIGVGQNAKRMPVVHVTMLERLDSPIALFEEAIKTIESRFPAQSNLSVPQDPLVCATPLMQNKFGIIQPKFSGQIIYLMRYSVKL